MASLREAVKDFQDELRGGMAWVIFWREGRSWQSDYLYLELGSDTIPYDDMGKVQQICRLDPNAVALNGYYCGHLAEDMRLDELTAGVRWHYENGFNTLAGFIEQHDGTIPPEEVEAARQIAHAAGLPFSERPYNGEDINPYIYDGSMTPEDYELMHKKIAEERSERMDDHSTLLEAYISNLGKYTENRPAGEWVSFPTTAEHMKEVFNRIGIDGKNYEEWHITEYRSDIKGLTAFLGEHEHPDELNYLGKLLAMQFDEDREKFTAAVAHGEYATSVKNLINLAQNLDCYWLYPSVHNEEEYGHYLIDELDELELPQEAKNYFMYEEYGRDASINDGGVFTEQGYIYNNRNTFTEWYDGQDIPKEYRVTPQFPQQPEHDENIFMDAAEMQQSATQIDEQQPRPVVPIILTSEKSADKVKEITARLEQGVQAIFDSERYKEFLNAMSKFHDYSLNNTILIAMQGGNLVKGFRQWQKEFDRHVKSGEKGIKIFAPAPYKVKKLVDKIDPETRKPMLDREGKPIKEEKEITVPAFKVVTVFDISQTEGKEFPDLSVKPLLADVEQYEDFFAALEKASPVPIAFEQINSGANGYFSLTDKRIAIKEGASQLQTLKTAIHEIAHARLHDVDLNAPKEEQNRVDRHTREVQAESVAYTVCQHFGLDTSDYSFGYVAGWSSGKEMSELKASLETIQTTAKELINEIEGHFTELQQQREAEQQQAPVFDTLPPEQQQALSDTVKDTLQTMIDADKRIYGDITGSTLEAIKTRGYSYRDGQLAKQEQPEATPDSLMTGETVKTPRGNFYVTDMSREQMEAAGYGFHHASDDEKYLIMGNGTQAFAVLAQQPERENSLKAVEDTVEQNDNHFDGIINNMPQTPTVDELEAKAKAGEAISLVDLANAIKTEKQEKPQKKPSILKKLDEYKKQAKTQQAKQPMQQKQKDMEVSQ